MATDDPDVSPTLLQKLTLTGATWLLVKTFRELAVEAREANRLTRLHIKALTHAPTIIQALELNAPPRQRVPGEHDLDVSQPTDRHYADLAQQFAAARARGERVDDDTDLSTLGDPERARG
jgi:hypothetical protein